MELRGFGWNTGVSGDVSKHSKKLSSSDLERYGKRHWPIKDPKNTGIKETCLTLSVLETHRSGKVEDSS